MEKRRIQALLNSVNEMPPEYQKYAGDWITLNIVAENYSSLDGDYHIMTAAAIWILDQLYESGASPQDVYQLLPRDGDLLEELYACDICDTQFDEELIASVEYVLRNRNRDITPLEDDGNDGKRYFTSILAAEGKAHGDVPSRKNFEALLGMIPQYRIDAAVSQFKRCYEVYQKHYFMLISYAADKYEETRQKIKELRSVINQERDHTLKLMRKSYDEYERNFTKKQKSAAVKPLIAPNALQINPKVLPDLPGLSDPVSLSAVTAVSQVVKRTENDIRSEMGPVIERLKQLENEHETLMDEFHDALELLGTTTALIGGDGYLDENVYEMDFSAVDPSVLDPLPFTDPYSMCFALLYLIEQENDIPWLYGSCIGMMREVADSLPWGFMNTTSWKINTGLKTQRIDVSLVRYADVIWIQTNAIPHRSYYSIVDTARKYHKPIRYFTFASATKCAEQLVENDQ